MPSRNSPSPPTRVMAAVAFIGLHQRRSIAARLSITICYGWVYSEISISPLSTATTLDASGSRTGQIRKAAYHYVQPSTLAILPRTFSRQTSIRSVREKS